MTVTNGNSPSQQSWNLDCAPTTHICRDQRKFERYTDYSMTEERQICNFAGRVAGNDIGHRDVRLSLRLPGGCRNEVVVRNVFYVKGAHNSLSQSRLMDQGLQIVPVNGYGIKIYDKAPAESTGQGGGNLVSVAHLIGGLFRLDVKVAGKLHRLRESGRPTAPYAPNEHFYREFFVPKELQQVISSEWIIVSEEL